MDTLTGIALLGSMFTVYAFYNGRATRTMLAKEEQLTRELIRELIAKMDERMTKMDERMVKMDERAEQRHREAEESLKESRREFQQLFSQMDKTLAEVTKTLAKMDEHIVGIPARTVSLVQEKSSKHK